MMWVFVSYRHGSVAAAALLDDLRRRFGNPYVLCDKDFIGGPTLDAQVLSALDRCGAVLVLIDAHWMTDIPRLHQACDWVQREIALALASHVPVLPVLVNDTSMPDPDLLPKEIQSFVYARWHPVDLARDPERGIREVAETLRRIEEGHAKAYRVYRQVMELVRRGALSEAVERIDDLARENADCDAAVTTNRIVPVLHEVRRDLLALHSANHAFELGRFEHARFALAEPCHLEGTFARGRHAAEIAICAAGALQHGDLHAIVGEQLRLAVLQSEAANAFVPGVASVKAFLDRASDVLKRRADLDAETEELWQTATHVYDRRANTISFDDKFLGSAGIFVDGWSARMHIQSIEKFEELSENTHVDISGNDHALYSVSGAIDSRWAAWLTEMSGNSTDVLKLWSIEKKRANNARDILKAIDHKTFVELSEFFDGQTDTIKHELHTTATLPAATLSDLSFTVTAPATIAAGATVRLSIWAHRNEDQGHVIREARRDGGNGDGRKASLLEVRLHTRDFNVQPVRQAMTWYGRAVRAQFKVTDAKALPDRLSRVTADVLLDGLRVARLQFPIRIGRATTSIGFVAADEIRHRSAFVSYAEEDRDAVRQKIDRLIALAPAMTIDDRCVRLRGRRTWRELMRSVIPRHNCLYLFWSGAASRSDDVAREWRCALEQGTEFISGISLDETITPPELGEVTFGGARGGWVS